MPEPRFRRYDPDDTDAVWDLHEWAMAETATDPADIPGTDDLRAVEQVYLDAGGEFLVGVLDGAPATVSPAGGDRHPPATADGTLVAMGGVVPSETGHDDERTVAGAAELHRMRVAPTHQRRGYGRALLDALERRAHTLGFERLLATTARTQPAAVAFYPAAGYAQVGESTVAGYDLVHYEKEL
jgi:GNAT superfamily N-acetyltransferase